MPQIQSPFARLLRRALPALALLAGACQQGATPDAAGPALVRLNALGVRAEDADAQLLLDRDTTTGVELTRELTLALSFDHDVDVRRLQVFARGAVEATLSGAPPLEVRGADGWEGLVATAANRGRRFTLTLRPAAGPVRVEEVELWGQGLPAAPRDVQALALRSRDAGGVPFENVVVLRAQPDEATLSPRGLQDGPDCATLQLAAPLPLRAVRRAHLVYEAAGLALPQTLRRSLDDQPAQGGFWVPADDAERTLADELDPERLTGRDHVTLCLPDEATGRVTLHGVRLVLELDDGRQPLEREAALRLAPALDGDERTAASVRGDALELPLARPTELFEASLSLDAPVSGVRPAAFDGSAWLDLPQVDLERGRTALALDGRRVQALRLGFGPSARADLPRAGVAELALAGSGVGPRVAAPRLVLTAPRLQADGARWVGERFGERAYLAGWTESPRGPAVKLEVDGVEVASPSGTFAVTLRRPAPAPASWAVVLRATFADGATLERTVQLDRDGAGAIAAAGGDAAGGAAAMAARFGAEEQGAWGRVRPGSGGHVQLGTDVALDAPEGAVDADTSIGITRKMPESVPPLDPGLVNVTAPQNAGYRFSPPGQRFKRPVAITLPYDPELLPEGVDAEQVQTYYYDTRGRHWVPLKRRQVLRGSQQVVSETDHFTFMINAVLALPDHPGPVSFDPTSIKNLKVATPALEVDLLEPPEANAHGSAQLALPIRLPAGRGAYTPELRLAYDSSLRSAGLLGVGWSLAVPSVEVDTRFGVPFYDGSERYTMQGEQLVPLGTLACADGSEGRQYAPRVEGAFARILRCGAGTVRHRWEVTDKQGTLYVYGATARARLASPLDPVGRIGQWMLERVLDAHGNLALFRYDEDRKRSPGTAFDQAQGEDFRQLYPSEIYYSGRATREQATGPDEFPGSEPGIYRVRFLREAAADGAPVERVDVSTTGRMGFKVVTRHRLGRVQVWLNAPGASSLVREYRLGYAPGDFDKSLLTDVELFGAGGVAGGARFWSHRLTYTRAEGTAAPFSPALAWSVDAPDGRALTASKEWSLGAHAYVGIGPLPTKEGGSVGVRVGFNHREGETLGMLADLNGDGLPDRLDALGGQRIGVQLNRGAEQVLASTAPSWDPAAGRSLSPFSSGEVVLGREEGDSVNAAIQAQYGNWSANVGVTRSWSTSRAFLQDADGDGLIDYVGPGGVLFNQPRGLADGCAADRFCFEPTKRVNGPVDFGNLAGAQGAFGEDPDLARAREDVQREFSPTDALLEWTAPYEGTVDVTGALAWRTPPAGALGPARDGVRLRVYKEGQLLAELTHAASRTAATPLSSTGVAVRAFERLYFVLSTQADFPVDTAAYPPVPLEAVRFSPRVTYTACAAGPCQELLAVQPDAADATGARVFEFDARRDFKIAGEPLTAVQAPRAGELALSGRYDSDGAADDVRVCVQRFAVGEVAARPCATSDVLYRAFPAAGAHEALSVRVRVAAGDSLVFRTETDLPADPASARWQMAGVMTEVCATDGSACAAPSPEDQARLRFTAEPYLPLHQHLGLTPFARPVVVPRDGTLHLESSAALSDPSVFFSARAGGKLLFKHRGGEGGSWDVPVRQGDVLTFDAHGEQYREVTWSLSAALAAQAADGGAELLPLPTPYEVSFDQHPFIATRRSPFGGGFHGWRYGLWGGRADETFDPSLFTSDSSAGFDGATPRERLHDGKGKLRDENTEESRRTRLFAPLLPRQQGTRLGEELPGLYPEPAFVSQDGSAFIAAGLMHGGHKGAVATGPGTARTVAASLNVGETSRASVSTSLSAGVSGGFGPVSGSLSLSTGSTKQRLDVLDMNGDGIIDVVVGGGGAQDGVRLTHLGQRGQRARYSPPGGALRDSSDVTASVGMGISSPVPEIGAAGRIRAMVGMYPTSMSAGAGFSATLSSTNADLVDVNGDGLPDRVRREGDAFYVRLNLGTGFAGAEDRLPVGRWRVSGDYDPFASAVGGGVETPDDEDAEEQGGREDALGLLEKLQRPDVVRRGTAVSLEGNLGFTLNESYGVTANWASSLSGTQVVLQDVTGDGLPDYVRKSSTDGAFHVRVNRGWGFGSEETWPVDAWPTGVTKPRFKLNDAVQSTAVSLLGLEDGIDTVDATGTHSTLPSVGFVVTVPILIGPLTPYLHLSGGADYAPERRAGFELSLMDINGDGLADHVLKTEEEAELPGGAPPAVRGAVFARVNQRGGGNLLSRVDRPLGGHLELAYERAGNTVDLPESRFVLTAVAVDDGTGDGAPGHRLATRYTYADGRYDRAEREFLGFGTVRQVQADGSQTVRTYANDTYARRGLLLREELRDASGLLYEATVNTYAATQALTPAGAACATFTPFFLSADAYCRSRYTPLERKEHRAYEGTSDQLDAPGMRTAQVTHHDPATGNVTLFEDLGDLADPADDLFARVTYARPTRAQEALHLTELPERIEVRAGTPDRPGALLREREGGFDDAGRLVRQVATIDGARRAETLLEWNDDGQLTRVVGPPNARGQRYELRYEYEPLGRGLTRRTVDSFGYTSEVEHDLRFGEAVRTVDVAGNVLRVELDAFGRMARLWGPGEAAAADPTIEVRYAHDAPLPWALTRHRRPADGSGVARLDNVVFVDGLGRAVQTKKDAELADGRVGMSVTGQVRYDVMGRVVQRGQTTFDMGPKTAFVPGAPLRPLTETFDVMGRAVRTVAPNGAVTTVAYAFGTPRGGSVTQLAARVTDALGNVRVMYRDAAERVSAMEEWIDGRVLTTRYETDPLGQPTRVLDAGGNATTYGYDLLGRRTTLSNPDTGRVDVRYDDAGNMVERTDGNLRAAGQSLRYEYDFTRLTRVDRPVSEDLLYEYGPPGAPENAAGRIVRVTDEAGVETRGYGPLGELTRTTRVVRPMKPGDRPRTFETRFDFDAFGRMLSIVYPDGELLRYGYDAGGLLRSATGYRTATAHAPAQVQTYLERIGYDEFGQRLAVDYGNGVRSRFTYEPDTRLLSTVSTRTPRGRTLQAITYGYDLVGNVVSQVNALGAPSAPRAGAVSYAFGYDALYRLTSAEGTALARTSTTDTFRSTFAYSDVHNLVRNTQVHALLHGPNEQPSFPPHSNHDDAYTYAGASPHQATRIGDTLFTYDANGNTLIECRTVQGSGCADTGGTTGSPETHDHYRRYQWTEDNALRAVVHGGGDVTRFFYTADGDRVAKLGRGGVSLTIGQFFSVRGQRHATKHIFAGPTRVASKLLPVPDGDVGIPAPGGDVAGSPPGCVPSDDQPNKCDVVVVSVPPHLSDGEPDVKAATYYYHPDHLGSTSWITDQAGKVHEHIEYFPYGEVWRQNRYDDEGGPARTPQYLFSGREYDEETGLGYFGARYYDPHTARWLSGDPMVEKWGDQPAPRLLSPYSYSYHSPMTWSDPDGELPQIVAGAIIGGVVGGAIYGIQAYRSGNFSARGLLAATAGGAVTGAIAGATMGASLATQVVVGGGVGAVVGGVTRRGIETGDVRKATDPREMAFDAATGMAGAGVGIAASKAVGAIAGSSAARRVSVWTLDKFARGREIEKQLGMNLHPNFPTIDFHDPAKNVVASIKSVDLNAATYQTASKLKSLLNGYVRDVAGFQGASVGQQAVQVNASTQRELWLALPKGAITPAQRAVIDGVKQQARAAGVVVKEFLIP